MRKRLALVTLAATAGLAGMAVSAGSAGASGEEPPTTITGYVKDYATSFTSPSTTSVPVHHLKPGMAVDAYCFRNGQALDGQAAWIVINRDGEAAYLHSNSVSVHGLAYC